MYNSVSIAMQVDKQYQRILFHTAKVFEGHKTQEVIFGIVRNHKELGEGLEGSLLGGMLNGQEGPTDKGGRLALFDASIARCFAFSRRWPKTLTSMFSFQEHLQNVALFSKKQDFPVLETL